MNDRQAGQTPLDLEVGNPLANWRALLWFLRLWRQRLIAAHGGEGAVGEKVDRLSAWVARCLWIALARREQLARIREQLSRALDLDPEIVRLALKSDFPRFRVKVKHGPRRLVVRSKPMLLASHYCRVWQNVETWRLVNVEAPTLLPVLTATYLAGAEVSGSRALQRAKTKFLEANGTERAWKWLARKGLSGIAVPSAVPAKVTALEAIAVMARTYTDLNLDRREYSVHAVEALLSFLAIEMNDTVLLEHRLSHLSAFLRLALPEAHAHAERGRLQEFLRGDFIDLAAVWGQMSWPTARQVMPKSWAALRRIGDDADFHASDAEDARWNSLIPVFEQGNLRFVALTSRMALAQEGLWHNHCVGVSVYAWRCRGGGVQIYSIRDRVSGRRMATLQLERAGVRWKVRQVAGTENAPVAKSIRNAAGELALRYAGADLKQFPVRFCAWMEAGASAVIGKSRDAMARLRRFPILATKPTHPTRYEESAFDR